MTGAAAMSSAWIQEFAETAIDPVRVRRALEQLAERCPTLRESATGSPEFAAAFAHLLSVSPISAEKLKLDPSALEWLARPEIAQSERGPRRMRAEFERLRAEAGGGEFDERFRALRRWKARAMLRIALREVAGWSSVEQTTLELTLVAELCVQVVTRAWFEQLAKRWGRPATEFGVLGMGKFGGQELNYSSDIDVIFFYGEDGQLNPNFSHKEFFTRLSERIIATFSATEVEGPLFRIDLRLRPEGASGPLARSLDSIEHYYAAFGETWERMALSKARIVGGDEGAEELGYEFAQRLQAFIYPRTISLEVLEEIRALKGRIEREIVGQAELRRNVKLGYGGIREIEFVTQTLQLLHGAKHAFLQERSTLKALRDLQELDLIPSEDMETLIDAYRWLRTVEHRLQIEHEAQTHLLPEQPEARARLAASLGFEDAAAFQTSLEKRCAAVRAVFDKVLGASRLEEPAMAVDVAWFHDPAHARRALDDLGGAGTSARFSPRTKQLFARLETPLLEWLRRVADPDTALTSFVRFVERYGSRGLLYETLLVNPRVLEVLVRLFDASRAMTDIVLRRPQLLEEIARGGGLGESFDLREYLAGLERNDEGLAWQDGLRAYRRSQFLRIGLRDLLGFADVREVQSEYSALAEACVVFALRQLGLEDTLTVVAMGKFGGKELGYGADLDVVFIGSNNTGASELMRALGTITAEGRAFPMDARLRPEGDKAPLTCSLESYEDYFAHRGQLWEAQALTKARPIGGPEQDEFLETAKRIWRRFGTRENLFPEIASMHERIRKERVSDEMLDFKTGRGGLMQIEFFIQAQQMRAGLWANNTLEALAGLEIDAGPAIARDYLFVRKVEGVLRLADDTSVSQLPKDELEQQRLAIRCGFNSRDSFLEAMENARENIALLAPLAPTRHE
jgi:glutamate-ammonia-ligase adenylyltransferase